ncbi:MAG: cytochrome P460 family protein [Pirellulaceae bacterium]
MVRNILPLVILIVQLSLFAEVHGQVSDEALLKFVRDRKEHIRVTSLPFLMDPITNTRCRSPGLSVESKWNASQPHPTAAFHIYCNEPGNAPLWDVFEKFPAGAMIVKEKIRAEDGATELFTGMLKHESGYSAEHGDWEYFTVDRQANNVKSRGRLKECMECHQQYEAFDFVTKVYSARLGREEFFATRMLAEDRWIDADNIVRCGTSQTIFLPASRAETFGSKLSRTAAVAKWRESHPADQKPPDDLESIGGPKLLYETSPKKNTLGYWVRQDDYAAWEFEVVEPGNYGVQVLQGCGKGSGGAEVSLLVGTQELRMTVEDTGHFQNFVWKELGQLSFTDTGTHKLTVKPITKPGVAVMDLRQIRLVRTPEKAPAK